MPNLWHVTLKKWQTWGIIFVVVNLLIMLTHLYYPWLLDGNKPPGFPPEKYWVSRLTLFLNYPILMALEITGDTIDSVFGFSTKHYQSWDKKTKLLYDNLSAAFLIIVLVIYWFIMGVSIGSISEKARMKLVSSHRRDGEPGA